MTSTAHPFALPPHLTPDFAKAHDYWKGLIRGQASDMPYWDDVKLSDLPGLTAKLILATVSAGPVRLRFDIVGKDISARYGKELAGSFADEIEVRAPLDFFSAQASATVEGRQPTFFKSGEYGRLLLPLWGDGHISMMLGIVA
jgi:hypothetical protein